MFRASAAPRVRLFGWLSILLAVGLTLAVACGGGGEKEATPTAKPAGSPTAAKTAAASPTAGKTAAASPAAISGTITIPKDASIKIGVSASLSGGTAQLGQDIRDGAVMAVDEVGTVKGHKVEIDAQDDGCSDAEKTVAVANRFVAESALVGVIGPMCSNGTQAANPIYEQNGIIRISPSSTRPDLTEQGFKAFFRTAWRDDLQGKTQADYALQKLNAKKAYVIDDTEAYGQALADEFEKGFKAGGGAIDKREKIAVGDTDFSGLVTRIVADKPDVVVFEGFVPEGTLLIKQLRDGGYTGKFMGPDGIYDTKGFVADGGAATEGAIVTGSPPLPSDKAAAFKSKFGREGGTAFIGQAYDAAKILLAAIDKVAEQQPDGSLKIDKAKLLTAIQQTDYTGLTGAIKFNAKGDRTGTTAAEVGLALYVVKGGKFEVAP